MRCCYGNVRGEFVCFGRDVVGSDPRGWVGRVSSALSVSSQPQKEVLALVRCLQGAEPRPSGGPRCRGPAELNGTDLKGNSAPEPGVEPCCAGSWADPADCSLGFLHELTPSRAVACAGASHLRWAGTVGGGWQCQAWTAGGAEAWSFSWWERGRGTGEGAQGGLCGPSDAEFECQRQAGPQLDLRLRVQPPVDLAHSFQPLARLWDTLGNLGIHIIWDEIYTSSKPALFTYFLVCYFAISRGI